MKEEITSGKYGNLLKAILDADKEEILQLSCETDLFQCWGCSAIIVHREKHIGLSWEPDTQYNLEIDITQKCPKCGGDNFKKIGNSRPLCPECKAEVLDKIAIGKWD